MLERLKSLLLSLLIACVIWLFAESQSLGDANDGTRIVFDEASAACSITPRDWDQRAEIEFRGSKAAIARARALLNDDLRLRPGAPGVPASDGEYTLDLLAALAGYEPLARSGVTITSVTPPRVPIIVRQTVEQSIPIAPRLETVQVEGPIRIVPERATVRLPKALWEKFGPSLKLDAAPTDRAGIPESGPASIAAPLTLPPELQSEPGVTMLTRSATLSFTVRSTISTLKFDLVPVWVAVPPVDSQDQRLSVQIAQPDQLLSAEVSGPRDAIERLRSSNDRLFAILSLTSDEIDAAITSKAIGFGVMRDGVLGALPPEIRVTPSKSDVSFTITRGAP